jgi:hypothetical protein
MACRRTRPTAALTGKLYRSKRALHERRAQMLLRQKVAAVLELQRMYLPLLERHRPLAPSERPWEVEP